jgi:hypothetical protein
MVAKIRKVAILCFLVAAFGTSAPVRADVCGGFSYYCQHTYVTGGILYACIQAIDCAWLDGCAEEFECDNFCNSEHGSEWGGPDGSMGCPWM